MIVSILFLLAALTLPGCATLINDDYLAVPVMTDQPGAQVRFNGHTHNTPTILAVPRGLGDQTLVFVRDGQEEPPVVLKETMSGAVYVNALFALVGLVFIAIDAANPHGYTLTPTHASYNFATHQLDSFDNIPTPDGGAWDGL